MNTLFQQTANCQFTICLTRGVHPRQLTTDNCLYSYRNASIGSIAAAFHAG
jgi:hypothetical protein